MTTTELIPSNKAEKCQSDGPNVHLPTQKQISRLSEEDTVLISRLLRESVEFVDHQLFKRPDAEENLFGQKLVLKPHCTHFEDIKGLDIPLENISEGVTLTSAQEIQLFLRFNCARMKVAKLIDKYRGKRLPLSALREILAWEHLSVDLRSQLAQANLPLVLAMAKRTRLNGLDFNEMVSEGNFALLRSIDKFDCSRGFKFSTYACRAILKSFSRVAMRTSRYRCRFPTEFDPSMEQSDFVEHKRKGHDADCLAEIHDILVRNRAELNDVEQVVIRERFALNGEPDTAKPKTLEQVGEIIGVTKERVRQIQNKALRKIRMILEEIYLAT